MRGRGGQVTSIDVLPDDALLTIFDFYVVGFGFSDRYLFTKRTVEAWQPLVHVCRRWRCVVFASPRRLDLRLFCTPGTPAREILDVWPALPLIVKGTISPTSVDNIVVVLGHRDRICQIDLGVTRGLHLKWDKVSAAMELSFPALTHLELRCASDTTLIPDTFLGGHAPRLRHLLLDCAPFSGIHNLLPSVTHLVYLCLHNIYPSEHISPEAMATCLSVLTSLRTLFLSLAFGYSRSRLRPPPTTRSVLPDLNRFSFKGASDFLDGLVAMVDAPRLDYLYIVFSRKRNYDTPNLVQFISRIPKFEEPNEVRIALDLDSEVLDGEVQLQWPWGVDHRGTIRVEIECEPSLSLVSPIAQVCAMCLPRFSMVEILEVETVNPSPFMEFDWRDDVEDDHWLDLLRSFPAVKSFYLSEELQVDLAFALQELVGSRTMEVLPSLQNIFLEKFELSEPFQEAIGQFLAARQLSGHPIVVLPM